VGKVVRTGGLGILDEHTQEVDMARNTRNGLQSPLSQPISFRSCTGLLE
jgi:hypothetical protein